MQAIVDTSCKISAKAQIAEYLRKGIKRGEFREGDRLPTTKDLVKHARVSSNTVRLAVSELEHDNMVKSVPGRGTFVLGNVESPNLKPNGLKRVTILPVFKSYSKEFHSDRYRGESVRGFLDECDRLGVMGMILPNKVNLLGGEDLLKVLKDTGCDGLIWLYPESSEWHKVEYLHKKGFPLVVTRRSSFDSDVAFVDGDYHQGGYIIGDRFIKEGCNKITIFSHFSALGESRNNHNEHCEWPVGIKYGIYNAFDTIAESESAENRVNLCNLKGFGDEETSIIFERLQKIDKNEGVVFTNEYHFYNLLKRNGLEVIRLLSTRCVVVVGNQSFLSKLKSVLSAQGLSVYIAIDPFSRIAGCAVQRLVGLLDGQRSQSTSLVRIELKKFSGCL